MMWEFISPKDLYHRDGHMSGFTDLCDWTNEGQATLRQIHDKFDNILSKLDV
jgi:hypothetical protein